MQEERSIFELDEELELAPLDKRFLAWLIDTIIVFAVQYLINSILLQFNSLLWLVDDSTGLTLMGGQNMSLIISWFYYAFQESSPAQATFGKRAMGIRVVTIHGGRLSFLNATGRYFAKILGAILLLIGFIMIFFNKKRQGLHDKLANTYVVY